MIPAHGEYNAWYTDPRTQHRTHRPVIAWNTHGAPLVAGTRGLIPAEHAAEGFTEIHRAARTPVVAVENGGGWHVELDAGDGDVRTVPVIAWVFRADGTAEPHFYDPETYETYSVFDHDCAARLFHDTAE